MLAVPITAAVLVAVIGKDCRCACLGAAGVHGCGDRPGTFGWALEIFLRCLVLGLLALAVLALRARVKR